ncbi:MAG: tryptophanase [Moheibacter sp.]
MDLPWAEPYKIKMTEEIRISSREERERWIEEAGFNLFNLESDKVFIDLLTDSGTGAMSDKQWSEMMIGDESYAGSRSYTKLKNAVNEILGFPYVLPTHQGRAAENVLFSVIVKAGDVVPGNSHFDTTKGHIEFRKASAIDCTIDEAFIIDHIHPFKGNIDLEKLEQVYKTHPKEKIPLCLITVTCNSSGGQPVSMANIKAVKSLSDQYGVPVFFDAARFAENAYFIKEREEGYKDKSVKEIVKEMFSYGEGFTMSAKKNGLVNIGGLLAFRNEELYRNCGNMGIIYEGYLTYGGLAGRDLGALAEGLNESTEYNFQKARIGQVEYLGNKLIEYGIPVQRPIGGHAVFVDALSFLPHIPQSEYPAQLIGVELYKEGGVRGVEIGTLLADRDPVTREERFPKMELLRLAIPQRTYTFRHMDYIAAALKNVFDRRDEIKSGLEIVWQAEILRHFTVKLRKKTH